MAIERNRPVFIPVHPSDLRLLLRLLARDGVRDALADAAESRAYERIYRSVYDLSKTPAGSQ